MPDGQAALQGGNCSPDIAAGGLSGATLPRQLQPSIPPDLQTICLKCLSKQPQQRYASAEALAEDLRRWQAHEPILARPVGRLERMAKWVRRRPAAAALVLY